MRESDNGVISRRNFLKLTGGLAVTGFVGTGLGALFERYRISLRGDQRKLLPTPQPTVLPDAPSAYDSLKGTATALENKGEQSSFQEEEGYTKEMFESVRKGTFMIKVLRETGVDKEAILSHATAWLARSEGNTHYFVTNRHVVESSETTRIVGLGFWRPGIDNKKFTPEKTIIATTAEPDLAVLKCEGEYNASEHLNPINWEDNFSFQRNDKALVVGFPEEFKEEEDELGSFTEGTIISIEGYIPETGLWLAKGIISNGNSGSPVIFNKDGQPLAVGIVFGRNDLTLINNENQFQKQPAILGNSLIIGFLIKAINEG